MSEHAHGLHQSAVQQRIDAQCRPYLHKPTNRRYRLAYSAAGLNEMHGISGGVKYVSDKDLSDTEIWSKQP